MQPNERVARITTAHRGVQNWLAYRSAQVSCLLRTQTQTQTCIAAPVRIQTVPSMARVVSRNRAIVLRQMRAEMSAMLTQLSIV